MEVQLLDVLDAVDQAGSKGLRKATEPNKSRALPLTRASGAMPWLCSSEAVSLGGGGGGMRTGCTATHPPTIGRQWGGGGGQKYTPQK